jgi:hypothetical protein
MVHQTQWHGKGKGKQNNNNNMPKQNTTFKKKKNKKEDEGCFMCDSSDHWAKKCPNHKGRKLQPEQKIVNMVTNAGDGTICYSNLPSIFQCFNLPLGGLILVQMFMCVLMLLYSLLIGSPKILL